MALPPNIRNWVEPEKSIELLTFGRRPQLLFRVLLLQLIVIFGEFQVFRIVHPAVMRTFGDVVVVELYLTVTAVAVVVLGAFVSKMSQLTFVPRFREPRHVALSMGSYLLLAGGVVAFVFPAPGIPPSPADGLTLPEGALSLMVTSNLAALVAVGFYAMFDLEDYPSRSRIESTVADWLQSLDWIEESEGSRAKGERYADFHERTEEMERLLEFAVTADGERLRTDFEGWVAGFKTQGLLSQEAIIAGDVENERLAAQHEALQRIVERLEPIAK